MALGLLLCHSARLVAQSRNIPCNKASFAFEDIHKDAKCRGVVLTAVRRT